MHTLSSLIWTLIEDWHTTANPKDSKAYIPCTRYDKLPHTLQKKIATLLKLEWIV